MQKIYSLCAVALIGSFVSLSSSEARPCKAYFDEYTHPFIEKKFSKKYEVVSRPDDADFSFEIILDTQPELSIINLVGKITPKSTNISFSDSFAEFKGTARHPAEPKDLNLLISKAKTKAIKRALIDLVKNSPDCIFVSSASTLF